MLNPVAQTILRRSSQQDGSSRWIGEDVHVNLVQLAIGGHHARLGDLLDRASDGVRVLSAERFKETVPRRRASAACTLIRTLHERVRRDAYRLQRSG